MASSDKVWSSSAGFVMATAGAAIGLGNLWRFPFLAGENGGGIFVLLYVISVIMIALPIMLGELVIGRAGGGSAITSMRKLISDAGAHPAWRIVGILSILIPFIGVAYYSVVGGWVVDYLITAIAGDAGLSSPDAAQSRFDDMLASPYRLLFAHTIFMLGVIWILSKGIQQGIEKASKILMPALFGFIFLLVIYAALYADFERALTFLFMPDFSKVSSKIILLAVGQSFFSLAIGVGILITYGAYIPEGASMKKSVLLICGMDTFVAVIAGLAIFPFVFSNGLDPSSGPGLIFVTLPTAFGQMSGGPFVGLAFFILLFCAAFSTGIGTLEPVVAWVSERRNISRVKATWISGALAWALGIFALLSFNIWQDFEPLGFLSAFEGKNIFDALDYTIASILLPINGVFISLFVGWVMNEKMIGPLGLSRLSILLWKWSLRVVVPVAIIVITYNG